MPESLRDHFRAFELLDDDEPMRGFVRVVQCALRDWDRLYDSEAFGFSKPFDQRFAKAMVKTVSHLVGTEPFIRYGYAEHGEFSLLLASDDGAPGETSRRLICRLTSLAAGRLSLILGDLALFDSRLYQFPSPELARGFLLWRQECQRTVSLNRNVLHVLTQNGQDPLSARGIIADLGDEEKLEILAQHGVRFDALPLWQRRGASCYWQPEPGDGPPTLAVDTTLPVGDQYAQYLDRFL
ncbi:MAG: tRNA(His) guanylyltransferase Thg1 family protein [Polyangia bacterium]|jgi:tRNA(His) 5'-end guanylyltransferase|nr:tRNA(His) guanylyltransferase Thg1 family protein [Polyangia bacterium]